MLEMNALIEKFDYLAAEGDRDRFDIDERYGWVIYRCERTETLDRRASRLTDMRLIS